MSQAVQEPRRYSYADLLDWPDDVRYELYDGFPVALASPSRRHQSISGELFGQLRDFLKGKPCRVYAAPLDVRPFESSADTPADVHTVLQPDLMVVCDRDKLDDRGVCGAPDLVIEIMSKSTKLYDKQIKHGLYEAAGVREYWVVDPDRQTVQVYTLHDGKYQTGNAYASAASAPVGVLPGCVIDLQAVFADL